MYKYKPTKIEKEIWENIPGYEGLYQVSNLGKIKKIYKTVKEKILKLEMSKNGYLRVTLIKNKKPIKYLVHRLVLRSFIGMSALNCNHKNFIKIDNRLENLEYCTQKENIIHAHENGHMPNKNKKVICLTNRKLYKSIKSAAEELNICRANISSVCKNKRKTVGGYKFKYA